MKLMEAHGSWLPPVLLFCQTNTREFWSQPASQLFSTRTNQLLFVY